VTNRTRQLAAQSCNATLSSVRHIVKKSHDAQDVNLDMMNAYLDDGVDYFLLLFPYLRDTSGHDLQLHPLRSVILGRIDCTTCSLLPWRGLSVSQSFTRLRCAKTVERIQVLFGGENPAGPMHIVLQCRGGFDSEREKGGQCGLR